MKILLTGHSGFLGQHFVSELRKQNTIVKLGRQSGDIVIDLSKEVPQIPHQLDIVIHSAGKAHSIPKNDREKKEFFTVNVTGTQNLLLGLEISNAIPKALVFISSVSVYGLEKGSNICEDYPMLAEDAYGKSKILCEELIQQWCKKHTVICTILRLPLIVGKNAPGNLKSMINALSSGYYFNVAGGRARKSMVLASDIPFIAIKAAKVGGIFNLTDGQHPSFYDLSSSIANQLGKRRPYNIPLFIATILANAGDLIGKKAPINSKKLRKITSDLTFNDDKAKKLLSWKPNQVLSNSII